MKHVLLFLLLCGNLSAQSYYSNGRLKTLTPVSQSRVGTMATAPDTKSDIRWYSTEQGEIVGVVNYIVVKWASGVDPEDILNTFELSGVKITETMWKITVPEDLDVFDLARELYLHESTVFATPDMIRERRSR